MCHRGLTMDNGIWCCSNAVIALYFSITELYLLPLLMVAANSNATGLWQFLQLFITLNGRIIYFKQCNEWKWLEKRWTLMGKKEVKAKAVLDVWINTGPRWENTSAHSLRWRTRVRHTPHSTLPNSIPQIQFAVCSDSDNVLATGVGAQHSGNAGPQNRGTENRSEPMNTESNGLICPNYKHSKIPSKCVFFGSNVKINDRAIGE